MLPFQTLYQEQSNNDKALTGGDTGLGNFHKTVRKLAGMTGQVAPSAFQSLLNETGSTTPDYARVPRGAATGGATSGPAAFVNPQAGLSSEALAPDPQLMTMPPAPSVLSVDTAAEMVELYHMALMRDLPFDQWSGHPLTTSAIADVSAAYGAALAGQGGRAPFTVPQGGLPIHDNGATRLGLDLPHTNGALNISGNTLFRCGLPGEDKGPLVSQFFLHDVAYGTQLIEQMQYPYAAQRDYLTTLEDWAHAQRLGRSPMSQRDYGGSQPPEDNAAFESPRLRKRIRNMRDLARFVHKDALHQAYFNAALLLSDWKAPLDTGNPYIQGPLAGNQIGFGTLGGPHLLTLVSEVASRALKVVWRQKWNVHLRLRPEAYGGALEQERRTPGGVSPGHTALWNHFISLGLDTTLLQAIQTHNAAHGATSPNPAATRNTVLLPMAFESGSPVHPAYGAGHATVAGACITVLKAWFDEDTDMNVLLANNRPVHPVRWQERVQLVQPGHPFTPAPLSPVASSGMTVGGELNKLASNVAMGRSMGGVHWRTDNTRSLRLGEQIATILMRRQCRDYAEGTPTWSYTSFDGHKVLLLSNGRVSVEGNPSLERFYNQAAFAPLN